MANFKYILPELQNVLGQYQLISHCLAGEEAVKAEATLYLPMPNAYDLSDQNLARYNSYKARANFYNVAQRTQMGLVGQIFSRTPVTKVPSRLDMVVADVDGAGVSLIQQSKKACSIVLAYSRGGLYVDFPKTNGAISVKQLEDGNIRPTIALYDPANIINWRTITVGGKKKYSLIVLRETYSEDNDFTDGFEPKTGEQYRVLKLIDNVYTVSVYRDDELTPVDFATPLGPDGKPLDEIPFLFLGVEANTSDVEAPAMYALCSLNMAHYRNSADLEEMMYICAQATPVATGLTQEWADKFGDIKLGSREGVLLPVGGDFKLVQAEENNLLTTEMEAKEKRMVALGAKLVEQKQVQRTATEASQDEAAETSILGATAKNVAAGYKWALEWAAYLAGLGDRTGAQVGEESAIEFDLNTEFDLVNLSPEERKQLFAEWQGGALTDKEYRNNLMRAGIAEEDFEEWEKNRDANDQREVELLAKQTVAQTPPDDSE